MFNIKSILSRSLLALALVTGAGAAFAGPTYHVSIDTQTLGTGTAYLDLSLGSLGGAAPVTATLSDFTGVFGSFTDRLGASSGSVDGTVVLNNSVGWSDLFQEIVLSGLFGFNVSFDTSGEGAGTTFGVALFGADMTTNLGLPGNLVQIDLQPGMADVVSPANAVGSATVAAAADVPEPADWALLMTGLGLMGFTLRRRVR